MKRLSKVGNISIRQQLAYTKPNSYLVAQNLTVRKVAANPVRFVGNKSICLANCPNPMLLRKPKLAQGILNPKLKNNLCTKVWVPDTATSWYTSKCARVNPQGSHQQWSMFGVCGPGPYDTTRKRAGRSLSTVYPQNGQMASLNQHEARAPGIKRVSSEFLQMLRRLECLQVRHNPVVVSPISARIKPLHCKPLYYKSEIEDKFSNVMPQCKIYDAWTNPKPKPKSVVDIPTIEQVIPVFRYEEEVNDKEWQRKEDKQRKVARKDQCCETVNEMCTQTDNFEESAPIEQINSRQCQCQCDESYFPAASDNADDVAGTSKKCAPKEAPCFKKNRCEGVCKKVEEPKDECYRWTVPRAHGFCDFWSKNARAHEEAIRNDQYRNQLRKVENKESCNCQYDRRDKRTHNRAQLTPQKSKTNMALARHEGCSCCSSSRGQSANAPSSRKPHNEYQTRDQNNDLDDECNENICQKHCTVCVDKMPSFLFKNSKCNMECCQRPAKERKKKPCRVRKDPCKDEYLEEFNWSSPRAHGFFDFCFADSDSYDEFMRNKNKPKVKKSQHTCCECNRSSRLIDQKTRPKLNCSPEARNHPDFENCRKTIVMPDDLADFIYPLHMPEKEINRYPTKQVCNCAYQNARERPRAGSPKRHATRSGNRDEYPTSNRQCSCATAKARPYSSDKYNQCDKSNRLPTGTRNVTAAPRIGKKTAPNANDQYKERLNSGSPNQTHRENPTRLPRAPAKATRSPVKDQRTNNDMDINLLREKWLEHCKNHMREEERNGGRGRPVNRQRSGSCTCAHARRNHTPRNHINSRHRAKSDSESEDVIRPRHKKTHLKKVPKDRQNLKTQLLFKKPSSKFCYSDAESGRSPRGRYEDDKDSSPSPKSVSNNKLKSKNTSNKGTLIVSSKDSKTYRGSRLFICTTNDQCRETNGSSTVTTNQRSNGEKKKYNRSNKRTPEAPPIIIQKLERAYEDLDTARFDATGADYKTHRTKEDRNARDDRGKRREKQRVDKPNKSSRHKINTDSEECIPQSRNLKAKPSPTKNKNLESQPRSKNRLVPKKVTSDSISNSDSSVDLMKDTKPKTKEKLMPKTAEAKETTNCDCSEFSDSAETIHKEIPKDTEKHRHKEHVKKASSSKTLKNQPITESSSTRTPSSRDSLTDTTQPEDPCETKAIEPAVRSTKHEQHKKKIEAVKDRHNEEKKKHTRKNAGDKPGNSNDGKDYNASVLTSLDSFDSASETMIEKDRLDCPPSPNYPSRYRIDPPKCESDVSLSEPIRMKYNRIENPSHHRTRDAEYNRRRKKENVFSQESSDCRCVEDEVDGGRHHHAHGASTTRAKASTPTEEDSQISVSEKGRKWWSCFKKKKKAKESRTTKHAKRSKEINESKSDLKRDDYHAKENNKNDHPSRKIPKKKPKKSTKCCLSKKKKEKPNSGRDDNKSGEIIDTEVDYSSSWHSCRCSCSNSRLPTNGSPAYKDNARSICYPPNRCEVDRKFRGGYAGNSLSSTKLDVIPYPPRHKRLTCATRTTNQSKYGSTTMQKYQNSKTKSMHMFHICQSEVRRQINTPDHRHCPTDEGREPRHSKKKSRVRKDPSNKNSSSTQRDYDIMFSLHKLETSSMNTVCKWCRPPGYFQMEDSSYNGRLLNQHKVHLNLKIPRNECPRDASPKKPLKKTNIYGKPRPEKSGKDPTKYTLGRKFRVEPYKITPTPQWNY